MASKEPEPDTGPAGENFGQAATIDEDKNQSELAEGNWIDKWAPRSNCFELDSDMETSIELPHRANLYVYDDTDLVKARVEWAAYNLDNQYLAGIWRADLFYQLCWYCMRPGRLAVRYRAPSWSWSSLDGAKIAFDSEDTGRYGRTENENWSGKWHPKILEAVAVPATPNPFGDAKSAKLTLLAKIRTMPFYTDFDVREPLENDDAYDKEDLILPKSEASEDLPDPSRKHLCLDIEGAHLDPSLKILRLNDKSCLIVEPVGGTKYPEVLKRVGYWVCDNGGFRGSVPGDKCGLDGWDTKVVILI